MAELTLQVQELTNKLTEMSKLSCLGSLKSQEILFLIEKSRKFIKILESFYTLKKDEEEELKKANNNSEINM